MLRPGDKTPVPIILYNSGQEAIFQLSIGVSTFENTSSISANLLSNITVKSNSTAKFVVWLSAPENATDELSSTFTLVAQSTLDESNDFINFQSSVSTRPPPEFLENVCFGAYYYVFMIISPI